MTFQAGTQIGNFQLSAAPAGSPARIDNPNPKMLARSKQPTFSLKRSTDQLLAEQKQHKNKPLQ
jgi:hypothetical protein